MLSSLIITIFLGIAGVIGAVLLGGAYSGLVRMVTGKREPFFTMLLAFGLGFMVLVAGQIGQLSAVETTVVGLISIGMLLQARRVIGLDNDIEEFGVLTLVAMFLVLGVSSCHSVARRAAELRAQEEAKQSPPAK